MKTILTAFLLLAPSVAMAQYQGIAAADGNTYVATSMGKTAQAAENAARAACYNVAGTGCKAISAPASNSFAVVQCSSGHVHMGADNTPQEAIRVARANAAGWGRNNCRVIYSD